MSTLYHSFHPAHLKRLFRKLDHIAIYILIAGSYTPYLLVALKENKGIWILTFVWTMAIIGICLDIFKHKRNETLQICIYLVMGWTVCLDFDGIYHAISNLGFFLVSTWWSLLLYWTNILRTRWVQTI